MTLERWGKALYAADAGDWECGHATKDELLETLAMNDFTTVTIKKE